MNLSIDSQGEIELWEAVATLILAQATDSNIHADNCAESHRDLFNAGGKPVLSSANLLGKDLIELDFDGTRQEICNSKESYIDLLAKRSGLGGTLTRPPVFRGHYGAKNGSIVVATKALHPSLDLPEIVWVKALRFLRQYNKMIYCLGEPGEQRINGGRFSEAEILIEAPMECKLAALAQADLVVGVPNAWTWMVTAWQTPMIVLEPETIPNKRWFWFDMPKCFIIQYDPKQLQVSSLLSMLRGLIEDL